MLKLLHIWARCDSPQVSDYEFIGCIDSLCSSPTLSWVCDNYIFYEGAKWSSKGCAKYCRPQSPGSDYPVIRTGCFLLYEVCWGLVELQIRGVVYLLHYKSPTIFVHQNHKFTHTHWNPIFQKLFIILFIYHNLM